MRCFCTQSRVCCGICIGVDVDELAHTSAHSHNESHVYLFTHLDFSLAYNGGSAFETEKKKEKSRSAVRNGSAVRGIARNMNSEQSIFDGA